MSTDKAQQSKPRESYLPLVGLMLSVVVIWAMCGYLLYQDKDGRGTFGDMFGAVNALFSGLAFSGIVYAILLQRRELELQREELSATRGELKRSASAQEKSEKALTLQAEAAQYGQRLAAINNMLEFSQECYRRLGRESLNAIEQQHCERWSSRRFQLMDELDSVYREVVENKKATDTLAKSQGATPT